MATTTPNYGWPVPTSTDLVKDGATAIEALGDAIDATVFGLGDPGITLISTASFSAVSSVSLAAASFTSTYTNYKLVLNATDSVSAGFHMRLRASGTDNTTSNYIIQNLGAQSTTVSASRTTTTSWEVGQFASNDITGEINIFRPQATEITRISYLTSAAQSTAEVAMNGSGNFNATTSFDSATIFPSSGTITGTYSLYGYAK